MKLKDKLSIAVGLLWVVVLVLDAAHAKSQQTQTQKKESAPEYDSLSDEYLKSQAKYNQFLKSHATASPEQTKQAKESAYGNFTAAQTHEVAKVSAGFLSAAFRAAAPKPSMERQLSKMDPTQKASLQKDVQMNEKLGAKVPQAGQALAALNAELNKSGSGKTKADLKQPSPGASKEAVAATAGRNPSDAPGSSRVSSTGVGEKMESAEASVITLKNDTAAKPSAGNSANPLGNMESVGGKPSESGGADGFTFSPQK